MNIQDILSLILIIAVFVITSCIVFVTIFLIQAIKSITNLSQDLGETTQEIKSKLQLKALAALPALVIGLASKFLRRGR